MRDCFLNDCGDRVQLPRDECTMQLLTITIIIIIIIIIIAIVIITTLMLSGSRH